MALSMNMMSLFDGMTDSPICRPSSTSATWSAFDIETIVTPVSKGGDFCVKKSFSPLLMDEDSGLGMDIVEVDESNFSTEPSPRIETESSTLDGSFTENFLVFCRPSKSLKNQTKRSLFAGKRSAECTDDNISPTVKKLRNSESDLRKVAFTNCAECIGSEEREEAEVASIIRAVDLLSTQDDLVADGSRDHSLPTVTGKHADLKNISAETTARLLNGEFDGDLLESTRIIDCRYPYEYNGGHIKGAVNVYTKEEIDQLLDIPATTRPRVLIFHCEFSSERGPKMYRFLRQQDRTRNQEHYPRLHYPEIYLLQGGYQTFYAKYKTLCDPESYKPMLHQAHSDDLRHFRAKSKSWAGDQKKSARSRFGTGRSLSFNK